MIIKGFDFNANELNAKKMAKKMVENGLYSRFNLSNEERINKATIGCLGELAFQHFLDSGNVEYSLDIGSFEDRNTDEYDILINEMKIDVKVAKLSTINAPHDGWTYGYPRDQNPSSKDYVVIGWLDYDKYEVGFYGWITGAKISSYPVVDVNSFAGYRYLTPNHEFKWGELNKNFVSLFNVINNT